MRPNHQKRMRGRNRNNGGGGGGNKGPNPLHRSFESNGPDVKVRGNAAHVAERYTQLARDAQSSGDPILAESYLQHAEHYFRMVAEYQASLGQPYGAAQTEDDEDGEFDAGAPGSAQPTVEGDVQPRFVQRQPNFDENGEPLPVQQPRQERNWGERQQQGGGDQQRWGRDRYRDQNRFQGDRPDRNPQDRFQQDGGPPRDGYRGDRPPRFQQDGPPREGSWQGDRPDRDRQDRYRSDRPQQDGQPRDGYRQDRPPRGDRYPRQEGGDARAERSLDPSQQPQPSGEPVAGEGGGEFVPRRDRFRDRRFGNERRDFQGGGRGPREDQRPQPETDEASLSALPSFITAPTVVVPPSVPESAPAEAPAVAAAEAAPRARKPRAPRRAKTEVAEEGAE